ncbi:MAG: endonuclease/exonuclease/phosphatase [Capsulimonas sp.]|nr:endonuclease/exonuclease/phosphatase [Capsulimonas sp.]
MGAVCLIVEPKHSRDLNLLKSKMVFSKINPSFLMHPIKLVSWNIRHGGRANAANIVSALLSYTPDLVLLSEYRPANDTIAPALHEAGFPHQHTTNTSDYANGILVASRSPFEIDAVPAYAETLSHRWVSFSMEGMEFGVLCVHIVDGGAGARSPETQAKRAFWEAVLQYARDNANRKFLLIGDLNTGFKSDAQGTPFACPEMMSKLTEIGWVDTWRNKHPQEQEYTWYSRAANGFRIDHSFCTSHLLPFVASAEYKHNERIAGISDHSIVIVEIADAARS